MAKSTSLGRRIAQRLRHWRKDLNYRWRKAIADIANRWRLWRAPDLGYLILAIAGPLPERDAPPRGFWERRLPLPPPPLSLETLLYNFEVIADAQNVRGIVIMLQPVTVGLATCQTLRDAIGRLRAAGKRVVVYTPYLTLRSYYIAAAADLIIAPPSAEFSVLGLQVEALYFKDTLSDLGVQAEVVRISPYKSALNQIAEATMSPEERAQFEWLLDEQYDQICSALAADRGLSQADVAALIDQAPFSAQTAVEHGLIDAAAYDDALATVLAAHFPEDVVADKQTAQVRLTKLGRARRALTRVVRRRHDRYIGVVQIEGTIAMQPATSLLPIPLPFEQATIAAEAQLTPLLRHAEQDDDLAALIVYVNSPGGDSLASDLIWQQIDRIRHKKPVVVYMGDTAASGGYYVAAPADWIVAQPATITGSIGVITGRVSTSGLYDKLHINRVTINRGARAGLYRSTLPLSDDERQTIWARVIDSYTMFKQAVAAGRDLPFDSLDAIAEGRVWTGRQALAHRLIDALGDFNSAVQTARELAKLPPSESGIDVAVRNLYAQSSGYVIPAVPEEAVAPATPGGGIALLTRLLQATLIGRLDGRMMYLLPFDIRFD